MSASKATGTVSRADQTSNWFDESNTGRYQAYSYSYPHKTAYREFAQPLDLKSVWEKEKRDALFLYLHIPFCEMRCGFCNLFTTSNPETSFEGLYLNALERQAQRVRGALGDSKFARMALGGGTPTYLDAPDLSKLFDMVESVFGIDPHHVPTSVETSPLTSEPAKLAILKERGIERISIGVQSFIETEVRAVGRSQKTADVEKALELIKQFGFAVLNIDLMYGLPGQTMESWNYSLERALEYRPEQIYLYPLYIRPLTGLEKMGTAGSDIRPFLYRQAKDKLIGAGYRQVSMRMFEKGDSPADCNTTCDEFHSGSSLAGRPAYSCQDDGMVGLGCGARSYTTSMHYSMRYAVGQEPVREILQNFIDLPDEQFDFADYGILLDLAEQKRRFLIQSLLQMEGLSLAEYERRFHSAAQEDFAGELSRFENAGLLVRSQERLFLSELGLEWSDRIGFELYSSKTLALMSEYESR